MEIRTCEEYVLSELKRLQQENEALRQQNEEENEGWAEIVNNLNKKLANYDRIIHFIKGNIRLYHSDTLDRDRMVVDCSAWDDEPAFVPLHDLYIEAEEGDNEQ